MRRVSRASFRKHRIKLLILGIGLILLAIGLGFEYFQIKQEKTAVNVGISLDFNSSIVTPVLRIGGYEQIVVKVDISGLPEINYYPLVIGIVDLSTGNYAKGSGTVLVGSAYGYKCWNPSNQDLAVCVVNTQHSQPMFATFVVTAPSVVGEWRLKAIAKSPTGNNSSKEVALPKIRVYADANLVLLIPPSVTAQVDGVEQEIGSIPLNMTLGRHMLSVPQVVSTNDMQLKFIGWYDYVRNGTDYRIAGSTNLTNHTVEIMANTTLYPTARYEAKYKVTATSRFSSSSREDWLNQGESRYYSRRLSPQGMNGTLGLLGGKWVFDGWYENGQYLVDSTYVLIQVSGPIVLEARWRPDYAIPIAMLGSMVIVVGASMFLVGRMITKISEFMKDVEKRTQRNFRKHRIKLLILAAVLIVTITGGFVWQARTKKTPSFMLAWGSKGSSNGQLIWPSGVAVDSSGNVYVVDHGNHRIEKFTSTGTYITQWGSQGSDNGQFFWPSGVAVDSSGNVYVADVDNYRVQKFSNTGSYLTQWGSLGSDNGQFNYLLGGVAVDSSGNVYVVDALNYRVEKFTSSGSFITQWGSKGSGPGQFIVASGVTVDSSGNVYVTDYYNGRVEKFTSTGTFITVWGSQGSDNGQFNGPAGVAVDSSGNVYVADWGNNRIEKFTSTGTYITQWGSQGSDNGQFNGPYGVAVDSAGNVYVVDWWNHRVQKFGALWPYYQPYLMLPIIGVAIIIGLVTMMKRRPSKTMGLVVRSQCSPNLASLPP